MESSGFFNADMIDGKYDRVYYAAHFAEYFSLFVKNGVFIDPADQLMVSSTSGLTVAVAPGYAFIDGYYYKNDSYKTLSLPLNESTMTKQYYIVCVLDMTSKSITTTYREVGTETDPINDGNKHELILASLSLAVGSSAITDAGITDRRPDSNYCGFVKGIGDAIDVTNIFQQFQAAFDDWFNNVKDVLSEDAAGNLMEQIEEVRKDVDKLEGSITEIVGSNVLSALFVEKLSKTITLKPGEGYHFITESLPVPYVDSYGRTRYLFAGSITDLFTWNEERSVWTDVNGQKTRVLILNLGSTNWYVTGSTEMRVNIRAMLYNVSDDDVVIGRVDSAYNCINIDK